MTAQEDPKLFQRSGKTLQLKDPHMDFYLSWHLGLSFNQATSVGEVLRAVDGMKEESPAEWQREFLEMAQRIEAIAEDCEKKGHKVSAKEAHYRASSYYRASMHNMAYSDKDFFKTQAKLDYHYAAGAKLESFPVEVYKLNYQGKTLDAILAKPDNSGKKRKTLIQYGGGETSVAELFGYTGYPTIRRDYNWFTFDVPGQGLSPEQGLFFSADSELALGAALDDLLSRPGVDPRYIASYGPSGGGYHAPRGAQFDKRVTALIANTPLDFPAIWKQMKQVRDALDAGMDLPAMAKWLDQYEWRWGGRKRLWNEEEVNKVVWDASKITQPAMWLYGEGEDPIQIKTTLDTFPMLPNKKKVLVKTTNDYGAESHCHISNISLLTQIIFDWLDELWA